MQSEGCVAMRRFRPLICSFVLVETLPSVGRSRRFSRLRADRYWPVELRPFPGLRRLSPGEEVQNRPSADVLLRGPRISTLATWLILPVVICLSQRLSHACVSMN